MTDLFTWGARTIDEASSAALQADGRLVVAGTTTHTTDDFAIARYTTTVEPPTVTAVAPESGPRSGGTTIIVSGTNFGLATTVRVGGSVCTDVRVASYTSLTCTTPAGTIGASAVSVTVGSQTASTSSGYRYTADVPGAPDAVTATFERGVVRIMWSTPASDGGSVVTGYRVERSVGSEDSPWAVHVADTGSTGTTFEDVSISDQTAYRYRVSALNATGAGVASDPTAPVFVAEPPGESAIALLPARSLVAESTLEPGDAVSLVLDGFDPFEWVVVSLRSTPIVLATTRADASGTVAITVALPSQAAQGSHTISLFGVSSGHGARQRILIGEDVRLPGLVPLSPVRVLDTRSGGKVGSLRGSGDPLVLGVSGRGGVPSSGVGAVVLNVTVVDAEVGAEGGFVTVYPCASGRPDASNLNFVAGQIVPNLVVAPVDVDGNVCFHSYGRVHLLADVSGYFPSAS